MPNFNRISIIRIMNFINSLDCSQFTINNDQLSVDVSIIIVLINLYVVITLMSHTYFGFIEIILQTYIAYQPTYNNPVLTSLCQHLLDEQISEMKSIYLASFGSEFKPLWEKSIDANIRTLVKYHLDNTLMPILECW